MDLTAAEGRVLGCLIELAALAPDDYPLTLNDLRLACNQAEARQPIVAYGDRQVEDTLVSLKSKGLARFVPSERGDRAIRYSHRAGGRWRLNPAELAVLAVLLLGGPQTLGAIQARASRLHRFAGAGEVEAALDALAARTPTPFAARLAGPVAGPRARWSQALVDEGFEDAVVVAEDADDGEGAGRDLVADGHRALAPTYGELAARVTELERRLAAASERQSHEVDDWARTHPYSRAARDDARAEWDEAFAVADDRALPAGSEEPKAGVLDRLADIERRLARIEAELGASAS